MKVCLIELQRGVARRSFNSIMPPILAVWAERAGWEVEVCFTTPERVDLEKECDVLGISSYTFLAHEGYRVAAEYRKRGKLVVMGGPHTKGCADEASQHVDAVFDRCDETSWTGFLKAVEAGEVGPSQPGVFVPSAEMAEVPPYREYKRFYGRKVPLLVSSLGCPYPCDFCADWDSAYFKREIDDVVADVRDVEGRFFVFCDPNFGVNAKFTGELLRRLVPLKKKYAMETNLALLEDEAYLALLRDSGCFGIQIGIESLSTAYAKNGVRSAESVVEHTIRRIRRIKRYIPVVQANFIFGLDEDTEEVFDLVLDLYRRSAIDTLVPHVATPFPGTPLYERLAREERIFEPDTRYYDAQNLVITLKRMSPERFYDRYIDVHEKLYSPALVLRKALAHFRTSRSPKNAALLLAFLARRAATTFLRDLPALRRARRRLASAGADHRWAEGLGV